MITVKCPCGRREENAPCLRGAYGESHDTRSDIRLSCDDTCESQARLRAFASAVGKSGESNENDAGGNSQSTATRTKYSEFMYRFAESEPHTLAFFENELSHIVLGKARKVALDGLPQLHRLVLHTLAEIYVLDSESQKRPGGKVLTVKHRGAGVKPMFPAPLLSEAYAERQRQKKRENEMNRVLYVHVASTTEYPGLMELQARVQRLLKSHNGSYQIRGPVKMSSNLTGVAVFFNTPERCTLVKERLGERSDVTVENPVKSWGSEANKDSATADVKPYANQSADASWSEGLNLRQTSSWNTSDILEQKNSNVQDNVPDSWDD
ncbi:unnamed protein product [Agarophyton chilense]